MGEARRRKLAGTYPDRASTIPRGELIAMAFDALAHGDDPTVSGMTIFPADGSAPVYLSAADAKRRPNQTQ